MKKKVCCIIYIVIMFFFYYVFVGSYLTFEMPSYPSEVSLAEYSIAPIGSILLLLIAIFLTPFIIGLGAFLFFKYPKQKRGDFWHYCLIYPGFAIFALMFSLLVWKFIGLGL